MTIGQRTRKREIEDSTNAWHTVILVPVANTAMMMIRQAMTIVITWTAPSSIRGVEENRIEKPLW